MTRADLEALAARVEAASGPDRDLDERIGMVIGLKNTMRVGHECLGTDRIVPVRCPAYTASLDAAMTLVPEGYGFQVDGFGADWWSSLSEDEDFNARAATPALALTAAALRARVATLSQDTDHD